MTLSDRRRDSDTQVSSASAFVPDAIYLDVDKLIELCFTMSQTHFKQAARYRRWRDFLGLPAAVLAAVTSAAAFSHIPHSGVIAGAFALTVTILTATNAYLNPSQKAERHWKAGVDYRSLHDDLVRFRDIRLTRMESSFETLLAQVDEFSKRLQKVNGESPEVDRPAFERDKLYGIATPANLGTLDAKWRY